MRRTDREITDQDRIDEIILSCDCCRLGFYDAGEIYIVPLSFGFSRRGEKRVFYFHGAKEGRKIGLISEQPHVGFELDCHYALHGGPAACSYTASFQSVIGSGVVSILQERAAKELALLSIMKHCTGKEDWAFSAAQLESVCLFQLEVEELSCKEHL